MPRSHPPASREGRGRFLVALIAGLCLCISVAFAQEPLVIQGEGLPPLYTGALPQDTIYAPLEVDFVDVGSADSILLRSGEYTMLVDSGKADGCQQMVSYLLSIGVTHLDYAFGTHPHDDHIGGFPGILQEIPVDVYLEPASFHGNQNPYSKRLRQALDEQHVPVESLEDGDTLQLGSATLTFYQWQKPQARVNNQSMIVRVECGDRSILLAADLEEHGQRALSELYGGQLQADILKFPHHGLAGYTREFHQAVQPALCIISNTTKSIPKTLQSLRRLQVDYLLTPQGSVIAITEGGQWQVWQLPKGEQPAAQQQTVD